MRRCRQAVGAVLAAALLTAACAGEGTGDGAGAASDVPVDQTVEIGMVDVAFEPTSVSVKAGSPVRFVFRNEGALPHQAYFGDEAKQQAYGRNRAKPLGVEVRPGRTRSFVHTFDQPGPILIGCHVPGHYQAGMRARLNVEPAERGSG